MIKQGFLNLAILGEFINNLILTTSLTEYKGFANKLFSGEKIFVEMWCVEICENVPQRDDCVYVKSIELSAANTTNAEIILSAIYQAADEADLDGCVSKAMEEYSRERYCKIAAIDRNVRIEDLHRLLSDETIASSINEICICLEMNHTLKDELAVINEKHHTSVFGFRLRYADNALWQGTMHPEAKSLYAVEFHHALYQSDAILLVTDSFFYKDEQLPMLKRYFSALPVIALKSESEVLSFIFKRKPDVNTVREQFFDAVADGDIGAEAVESIYEKMGVPPVLCAKNSDLQRRLYSFGSTRRKDNDQDFFDYLVNLSFGGIADKLLDFYNTELDEYSAALKDCSEKNAGCLLAVPEGRTLPESALRDFLVSDRPMLSANGGIAMKSHGKLKFPESCCIAENICEFMSRVIDDSKLSEMQKKLLKIRLLKSTDGYSMPDERVIIRRDILEKAVVKARETGGDILPIFARSVIDFFEEG